MWIDPGSAASAHTRYVDEMQMSPRQPTLGASLRVGNAVRTRLIHRSDTAAVVSVTVSSVDSSANAVGITSADSVVTEYSCFVRLHEGAWKLSAVRSLPHLSELRSRRAALQANTARSADEQAELERVSLVVGTNDALRMHIRANRNVLQRIVDLYRARKVTQALKLARTVSIIDIDEPADAASSRLELIIGGMHDSVVGIMYVPHPEDVPAMTPSDIIMVEEVEPMFYVFKTM